MDVTVEAAHLTMIVWDKKFKAKLRRLGIKLKEYDRYLDEKTVVMNALGGYMMR